MVKNASSTNTANSAPKPRENPPEKPAALEIVCGFHGVAALTAAATAADVVEVLLDERRRDRRMQHLRGELERAGINLRTAPREELTRLADGVAHQGVLARVRRRAVKPTSEADLSALLTNAERAGRALLLLILDQVQDPHNLGACLRTAAATAVDAVIVPKDGACPPNATVTRVSAGAAARVPLYQATNLARTMAELQRRGVWIAGGDHAAKRTLYELDFTAHSAIAIGAEGGGLRRLTRRHCDQLARIPMPGEAGEGADRDFSLNLSVAAGVFLYEAVRQRMTTADYCRYG